MTAKDTFDHEIDPHGAVSQVLNELGTGLVEPDADWSNWIDVVGETPASTRLAARASQIHRGHNNERDCVLIGSAAGHADEGSAILVTNDEEMLKATRVLLDGLRGEGTQIKGLVTLSSVDMVERLFDCGAIDMDAAYAAFDAEWKDVGTRRMGQERRDHKRQRLEELGRMLSVAKHADQTDVDALHAFRDQS